MSKNKFIPLWLATVLFALPLASPLGLTSASGAQGSALTGEQLNEEPSASLKPDVPKLDNSVKPHAPLKGAVQHSEAAGPKPSRALKEGAAASQFYGGAGKAAVDNNALLKAKARHRRLESAATAENQSGIGIIGVKFVMGFGRPPIINRVFPGTPAAENGLRTNDIIIAVDGIPTYGLTKDEVYNMIVGVPHTPVSISFRRNDEFQVKRMERMDFNDITDPKVRRDYQSM